MRNNKTILVTGANGQLGNEMQIVARGSEDRYMFTDVAELDITDAEAVEKMIRENRVDVIVNCAAYTNVDKAEEEPAVAERLNALAVKNLAESAKRNDAVLVHISTDYVFGGTQNNTPCREDQPANPTGVYGTTKLQGEEAIKAVGCRYIIIRTAWLYSEFGKNFLKTMWNLTAAKPELKVVFDQTGTPTYAYDLAKAIFEIIESRKYEGCGGTYHYSNEGVCSWYDFTKMIAAYTGHNACRIYPCHSNEFPSKVVRPSYSVLDKTKFKDTFGIEVPYWTDSLKKCIDVLKK